MVVAKASGLHAGMPMLNRTFTMLPDPEETDRIVNSIIRIMAELLRDVEDTLIRFDDLTEADE